MMNSLFDAGVTHVSRFCSRSRSVVLLIALLVACGTSATTTTSSSPASEAVEEDGVSGRPATDAAAGGAQAGDDGSPDWCAAQPIVEAKCQRCHDDPPTHGAPFSLVSYEDTQYVSASGRSRLAAIEKVVGDGTMPASFIRLEPPVEPLDDAEKELLLAWCRAGARGEPAAGCAEP